MKKYTNILIILLSLYILLNLITNENINNIIKNINIIYYNKLFITLLPFYIIIDILLNYNITYYIEKIIKRPYQKIFNESNNTIYIFILSILSSSGVGKYINDALEKKEITPNEANHLLTYTHFTNPIFLLQITNNILNKDIVYLIIIVQYTLNILIGIIFKNKYKSQKIHNNKALNKPLINTIKDSITKNINNLTIIYGIFLLTNILSNILFNKLNINLKIILTSIIEITSGLNLLNNINIPTPILASIITLIITFGGISIHMQIFAVINNDKIKYSTYLKSRILHSLISTIIVYIITSSLY